MSQFFPFLLLLCLLLVALFAASEAALAATNRVRLRHLLRSQHAEDATGESPNDLSRDSQDFIATVTIAANIPLVAAASLTLWMGWDKYGSRGAFWISLGVALLTVAFFQIAPRLVVSAPGALENLWWLNPRAPSLRFCGPAWDVVVDWPHFAGAAWRFGRCSQRSQSTNDDEIRDLVEAAGAGGALDESRELIESIFTFGDTRVHEVMIPRPDITALPIRVPRPKLSRFSKTPVCRACRFITIPSTKSWAFAHQGRAGRSARRRKCRRRCRFCASRCICPNRRKSMPRWARCARRKPIWPSSSTNSAAPLAFSPSRYFGRIGR
jgi:Mg2+/Co2+ transporter CorB